MSLEALRSIGISASLEKRPLFSGDERIGRVIGYLRQSRNHEVFGEGSNGFTTATTRDLLAVRNPQTSRLRSVFYPSPRVTLKDSLGTAAKMMFDYRLRALPVQRMEDEGVTAISGMGILGQIPRAAGRG